MYSRLAGRETFGGKAQTAAAPSELHFQCTRGARFEEKTAVRVGDGNGVIQHRAENGIQWKLRVQKRSGFEKQVELAQTSTRGFGTGDVFNAREQLRNGILACAAGGAKQDLVGVIEPEGDRIAVLELAAFHFFAVDEKAATLAAILDVKAIGLDDDGRTVTRDAAIGELQVVASLRAAADQKRSLRDAHVAARAVWRDDFENHFAGGNNRIGHRYVPRRPL